MVQERAGPFFSFLHFLPSSLSLSLSRRLKDFRDNNTVSTVPTAPCSEYQKHSSSAYHINKLNTFNLNLDIPSLLVVLSTIPGPPLLLSRCLWVVVSFSFILYLFSLLEHRLNDNLETSRKPFILALALMLFEMSHCGVYVLTRLGR